MKISPSRRAKAGYISTLLVLSTGAILSILTLYAYRAALTAQAVQTQVQLRVDYSEKEEAILRSIVAIAPNRAIRAMQSGSNADSTSRFPLTWESIFKESLILANARTSIDPKVIEALNVPNLRLSNVGDSELTTLGSIFKPVAPHVIGYVAEGINLNIGTGFPPLMTCDDSTTSDRDQYYPIISKNKKYGTLAQANLNSATLNGNGTTAYGLPFASYPEFNRLKYPQINFGYAKPGDPFVAKRNWWTFEMDVAEHDYSKTRLAHPKRQFVLSIYEIPSQLAISASSFMSLGQFAGGAAWQNVTISGGIFAGKAEVLGDTTINSLASRRSMSLSSGTTIGGQSFAKSPFTPGVREAYQVTSGAFFPVSQSSESGRSAFIPINRGAAFFDRFDPVENAPESNSLSSTTWNSYSIGANQCAMRVDITGVTSPTDSNPTMLRFQYFLNNGTRASMNMPLTSATQTTLPPGYVSVCSENQSWTFSSTVPVDVAYGKPGGFTFRQGVTGTIAFDNTTFGDPLVGTGKLGYWRPQAPFEIKPITSGPNNGQFCVAVYPERIPAFLSLIGAAAAGPGGTAAPNYNNSLLINVDYSTTGLNNAATYKPRIPCTSTDYGVILKECANLSTFSRGFSLVTNLRLYIGDDFNTTVGTPPTGYTPAGTYYPPCSLFAPEKRYGVDVDPFAIELGGQIGSLASESDVTAVRPLDSKNMSGAAMTAANITVNLRPISHPAELPPITMMNWLVLLEERRKEYY
jgi:hypothetical protein